MNGFLPTLDDGARSETADASFDVVIVGSGPIGATFARAVADRLPSARILMVELGPVVGDVPGANLKNVVDPELRSALQRRSQGPSQDAVSASAREDRARHNVTVPKGARAVARPGTHLLSASGHDAGQMPAAAMSTSVGGMGAHWTCACPSPYGPERAPIADAVLDRALETARSYFSVSTEAYELSPLHAAILGRLQKLFPAETEPHRAAQRLPMAIEKSRQGLRWFGPGDLISEAMASGQLTLWPESLCRLVEHDGTTASAVIVKDTRTGSERRVSTRAVVIAADAFRTPQLLWASGIRPAALGSFLNEHIQVISGVAVSPETLGVTANERGAPRETRDADPVGGVHWIPFSKSFPFHGQVTVLSAAPLDLGEPNSANHNDVTMTLSWFCPTEVRPSQRITFASNETDEWGMPRMSLHFDRSERDQRTAEAAVSMQERVIAALGRPTRSDGPLVMPPGSSLHYTGTTRMGTVDDGNSVCDTSSRVWGMSNVFVGGNGVIPGAAAGNPTLHASALAVLASEQLCELLGHTDAQITSV